MENFTQIITKFHYTKNINLKNVLLFAIFFIPSLFYSLVIRLKNFLYNIGIKKENTLECEGVKAPKIICIGNLTTGGVGKTPVVIEFAKYLSEFKNTVVLSRGYKNKLNGANIIKNYKRLLIKDANVIGDEVRLIADNSKENGGYGIVTSKDRYLGAKKAIDELDAEFIIMDDGFSNRKLKKDLAFVLFDSKKFIGNGFLLPLGPLREPLNEIKRADGIIIVNKENLTEEKLNKLKTFLSEKFKKPIFKADFAADYYYDIITNEKISPENEDIIAFCGIGQPEQFYNLLKKDFNIKQTLNYNDHHLYTEKDIEKIKLTKEKAKAKYVLTTEKDAVKIKKICKKQGYKNIIAMKLKADIDIEAILSNFKVKNEIK